MRQFAIGMMLTIWGGAALHPARAIHARDLSPELTVGLAAGEFNLAYEADADRATGASVGATASTRCSTPTRT